MRLQLGLHFNRKWSNAVMTRKVYSVSCSPTFSVGAKYLEFYILVFPVKRANWSIGHGTKFNWPFSAHFTCRQFTTIWRAANRSVWPVPNRHSSIMEWVLCPFWHSHSHCAVHSSRIFCANKLWNCCPRWRLSRRMCVQQQQQWHSLRYNSSSSISDV